MSSLNKVSLLGNLTKDVEVRYLQNGKPVANMSLATSERWKDKQTGEQREKTEFHRIVIFSEGLCKIAEQYLRKGSKVYLEGQLQTRSFEQDGITKYSTEILLQGFDAKLIMLDSKPQQGYDQSPAGGFGGPSDGFSDQIPFRPW